METAENNIDWAAAFTQRRPELQFETILEDFRRRAEKSEGKFEALEFALGQKNKRLLEENMLVIKRGENGWYAAHFRNFTPENVSNAVEVIREKLHLGVEGNPDEREIADVNELMGVITPFVERWEKLIRRFSNYYEDTKIGAELAAKFGQLQAACKLLWTAKDRMRPGTLRFNREKYTKAFDAFVAYYLDLPRESGKIVSKVEDENVRDQIVSFCVKQLPNWAKENSEKSLAERITEFYKNKDLWQGMGWMTKKKYRYAFDPLHTKPGKAQTEENAIKRLYHIVHDQKPAGLFAKKSKSVLTTKK